MPSQRFLSIEDNPDDELLIRRALAESDLGAVDLVHAPRLEAGLELLAQDDFAAVLLDLSLPDGVGIEVVHRVLQVAPRAAIVALSSSGDTQTAVAAVQAGAQDYLTKGRFDGELIGRALRYAIERKRLALAAEDAQRAEIQRKDTFLSHVSHELRTPLSAIQQFTSILQDGLAGELLVEQRDYVGIIMRNSRQLQKMIEDLLEVTRIESGRLVVETARLDIGPVVQSAVEAAQEWASSRRIRLESHVLPAEVAADPARIQQILGNLIENAIKFTPEGGRVVVRAGPSPEDPSFVRLSVEDNGCGIPPQELEAIFEWMNQSESNTTDMCRKGLGLGLSVCRELVYMQGGTIHVTSEVGHGSEFHVLLPTASLTRQLLPLCRDAAAGSRSLHLVRVELAQGPEAPTSVPGSVCREVLRILGQCTTVDRDLILPVPRDDTRQRVFQIVSRACREGPTVVLKRISRQLASNAVLTRAGYGVHLSDEPIAELPDTEPERRAGLMAARIEELLQEERSRTLSEAPP